MDLKKIYNFYWGGTSFPAPVPMGTLIDFDFTTASDLNDFTVVQPSSTIGLSGGYLRSVQSPGTGTFVNYITYDTYGSSALEKSTIESIVIPKTSTADSYGLSIGMKRTQVGVSSVDLSAIIRFDTVAPGQISIYAGPTPVSTGGTSLTFSVNDRIKISYNRNANVITFTAENLTNPNTVSVNYTISTAYPASIFPPLIGKPTMYFNGGTQDIEYFKYSSTEMKNANVTFFGDSITVEYGVAAIADRYANKTMFVSTKEYNVNGSCGAITADLLLCQNEITLLNSRYNVFCIGVNDQFAGINVNTSKANLQSLLANTNNTKILNYLIPFQTNNPATWNAMIDTIATNSIVDLTTVLGTGSPKYPNATYYNADLIHPNTSGAIVIANEYLLKHPELV